VQTVYVTIASRFSGLYFWVQTVYVTICMGGELLALRISFHLGSWGVGGGITMRYNKFRERVYLISILNFMSCFISDSLLLPDQVYDGQGNRTWERPHQTGTGGKASSESGRKRRSGVRLVLGQGTLAGGM
jgi:hypothetical protein